MRIIVWGINYSPEVTGIAPYNAALCEQLRASGHDVRMLTTFSYYPAWKKESADRGRLFRTDSVRGVLVHRCWHYVPGKVSALKRILHEGSFVLMSWLRLLSLPKADVLVVVSPPLLLGAAAWLAGKLRGMPFVFHVQDLQPDAAVGLGMLKAGAFTRVLYALERLAYAQAARVSVISGGMRRAILGKGVPETKTVLFPNGAPDWSAGGPPRGRFRARCGFGAEDFLAIYSGNLGVKQGLGILLDAAPLLRDPRVKLVLCGGGAQRGELEQRLARERPPNVRLLPLQDDAGYAEMMADTDVSVITQQKGTGQFFFPSKLLASLAAARPVLAVADDDSELALALREGGFGVVTPAEDAAALARALDDSAALPPEQLAAMGAHARVYGRRFRFDRVLPDFERELMTVAGRP